MITSLDSRAAIHPNAKIGKNVSIGAFSVIGGDVELGEDTEVGPHVVIDGITKIGKRNKIFQFAAIGAAPQDVKYKGEETSVEIGDDNVIREFCTIHAGTIQGKRMTKIGNRNFLLNYVHIAHDCVLGNNCIFTNNTALSGHVNVGSNVVLGGFVKVLQFCEIGDYSFVGGSTDLVKDVLPYSFVAGLHGEVKVYGLNLVGLRRNNFTEKVIGVIDEAFRIVYRENLTVKDAISKLKSMQIESNKKGMKDVLEPILTMLRNTKKGITR